MSDSSLYLGDPQRQKRCGSMVCLERRLDEQTFIAGHYSIADIATYPWVARHEAHKVRLENFPNVKRWFDELSARPAVQRGMVPKI